MGVGRAVMQRWWHAAVVETEAGFDQARNASSRFEVSYLGFYGADQSRVARVGGPDSRLQTAKFNCVSKRSTRPMGFDVADGARRNSSPGTGLADHLLLRPGVWCGNAIASTVLVHGRADHLCVLPMVAAR